jgi:hypothetical protein
MNFYNERYISTKSNNLSIHHMGRIGTKKWMGENPCRAPHIGYSLQPTYLGAK